MANYYSSNANAYQGTSSGTGGANNPYNANNPYANTNTNNPSNNTNSTENNANVNANANANANANTNPSDPYGAQNVNQQWQQPTHSHTQNNQQQQQQQQQQYTSTTQNQPAQQQQQQQQGQGGSTPFWNPAMTNAFASAAASAALQGGSNPNAMLDVAGKIGHTFLDEGTARMIPGLEQFMSQLRVYFQVDNTYVKSKMLRVLFSFFFKNWSRVHNDLNAVEKYALPREDVNALDLYIPSMSLITYVLLCGLCYGTSGEFNPEVLPQVTTRCMVIQFLEVLLFRIGFYMMQAPVSFMDLFAVTGYKYLGLTMNMLVGYSLSLALVSGGHRGYYGTFLWTASASSYFMLKYMGLNIPDVTSASGPKKEFMVLAFAGSQFASMWFLGQTKFLN